MRRSPSHSPDPGSGAAFSSPPEEVLVLGPDDEVPTELVHASFVAAPLTAELAALDHAAYVASPDVIRVHSDGRWPTDRFTLEDNRDLVRQHQADHEARRAFTFALLDPARSESVGCLYLNPLRDYLARAGADRLTLEGTAADATMVTFWLRAGRQHLTDAVVVAVDAWVREAWPFPSHVFRALPAEQDSVAALARRDLERVTYRLPDDPLPYLWWQQLRRHNDYSM